MTQLVGEHVDGDRRGAWQPAYVRVQVFLNQAILAFRHFSTSPYGNPKSLPTSTHDSALGLEFHKPHR